MLRCGVTSLIFAGNTTNGVNKEKLFGISMHLSAGLLFNWFVSMRFPSTALIQTRDDSSRHYVTTYHVDVLGSMLS